MLGSIVGGVVGNVAGTLLGNSANRGLARDQMNFQREMSNTAHQREVKDLMKAGLNPVLSAGGSGSSTPSGASAQMQMPQIDLPAIISMYTQEQQLLQNQQRINIEAQNSAAGIAKTLSETEMNKMKKILLNKGMPRAQLEGEASKVLTNIIKHMNKQPSRNAFPGTGPSNMQDLPWKK